MSIRYNTDMNSVYLHLNVHVYQLSRLICKSVLVNKSKDIQCELFLSFILFSDYDDELHFQKSAELADFDSYQG